MIFNKHVNQKLSAYCHGELPAEEANRVAQHLLDCRRCQEEYEQIKFGAHLAEQLSRENAPMSLWGEIESSLDRAESKSHIAFPILKFAAVGAAALLLASAGLYWRYAHRTPTDQRIVQTGKPTWAVMRLEGSPKIDERQIAETDRIAIGESLLTDSTSRAQVSVSDIGEIELEPNSRIRLIESREDEHRISLSRGQMQVVIWAPPLKFFVDTPSAVAVDLGCAYTLEVNDDGQGLLQVQVGVVAFEWEGRESFVPEGAMCVTRPGMGPGTPHFSDAPVALRNALAIFDTEKADVLRRAAALKDVLKASRKGDALTLWHLLSRTRGAERELVFDRLAKLIPPPAEVTREGILLGDRSMLDAWGNEFELVDLQFWRSWKRPLPSK